MNSRKRGEKTVLTIMLDFHAVVLAFMHLGHTKRYGGKETLKRK